jgi:hypothetical protein
MGFLNHQDIMGFKIIYEARKPKVRKRSEIRNTPSRLALERRRSMRFPTKTKGKREEPVPSLSFWEVDEEEVEHPTRNQPAATRR